MPTSGASACTICDCPPGQVRNGCGGTSPGVCESCGICPPGENRLGCVGIAAGSCVACGAGKYKTSSGTNLCVSCEAASLCPSNSYRSGCGGDSEGACADCGGCPAGAFRTECEKVSPGRCATCAPGSFKTSSGTEPCSPCVAGCDAGTYQSNCTASSGTLECTNCTAAPGFYCPAGSTYGSAPSGTACPVGHFCHGGSRDKQMCAVSAGWFCPSETKSADGTKCPAGYYCTGKATGKTACVCRRHGFCG